MCISHCLLMSYSEHYCCREGQSIGSHDQHEFLSPFQDLFCHYVGVLCSWSSDVVRHHLVRQLPFVLELKCIPFPFHSFPFTKRKRPMKSIVCSLDLLASFIHLTLLYARPLGTWVSTYNTILHAIYTPSP